MTAYFPAADNWQSLDPTTAGFDPAQLAAAFSYAATQEIAASRDLRDMVPKGERHPYDRQLGPLQDRSPAAGLVGKSGYLVGSFGPIDSVEVTFSCSKSYISAVAGEVTFVLVSTEDSDALVEMIRQPALLQKKVVVVKSMSDEEKELSLIHI